ncbi:MAG: hypothetical protein H6Q21_1188 [Bacteroidetes bacterium]|nr:hypothetical protein [Bacteroidota bacterium]
MSAGCKIPLGLLAPAKPVRKAARDPNWLFNIKERTRRPPSLVIQLGFPAPAKPVRKAARDPNWLFNIKERTRRLQLLVIQLGFIDSENVSDAFIQIYAMAAAGRQTNYRIEVDRLSFNAGYDLKHLPGIGFNCFVIFIPDHLFCDEF